MGLFSNKKEEKEEVPSIPKLPRLPEIDNSYDDENFGQPIHRLPSYPPGTLGTNFSHNTIKEAVSGEIGGEEFPADELMDEDEMRMMQEPPEISRRTEEIMDGSRRDGFGSNSRERIAGPVFIRIDKFEDALEIFNESKKKILEIEKVLEEIKKVKDKEEKELQSWEKEVKSMKDQVEKVDQDIFSKV